jgi:3-hydroxyisobutyrate dehydrogenase
VIAWLGIGLLGSNFVRRLRERGEEVHVWNRTPEKARALEADGAKAFDSAADAVRGASVVHVTLGDDASVDAVLEPLAATLARETLVIDHTTTAPTPTGERVARWKQRGITFVHAPVFMGPPAARQAQGLMLLSGDTQTRARVKPLLEPMTGKVVELGDDPTRGASLKLFGNMLLVFVVSGLADGYRFMRAQGIDPVDAHALFNDFNLNNSIGGRGKAMASGDFTPMWELSMARKDVRLMTEEAQRHGAQMEVLPAIAQLFDRYIQNGDGRKDVGIVAVDDHEPALSGAQTR